MGRNTTTPSPQSLDRFSIGEITQLSGVASFYNAGTSKWLKSGTFTDANNLNATTKTNLAAASTGTAINTALITTAEASISASYPFNPLPIQRISASNVAVYPACANSTTPLVIAVTSAGFQSVPISAIAAENASNVGGNNVMVASDGTTIFAYVSKYGFNTLGAASTTNGTTWTAQTLTGLPAINLDTNNRAWGGGGNKGAYLYGKNFTVYPGYNNFAVFWCGARFVAVLPNNTTAYMVCTLSTNGIAWGGNQTTTVLNNTTVAYSDSINFFKNGNSCWLAVGNSVYRYTTDGGITWADATISGSFNDSYNYTKANATTSAKFFITDSATAGRFTANSGATFTNRTFPIAASASCSLAYRGSTVLISNSSQVQRSVDDGATWTQVIFPVGTLANGGIIFGDANRFYFAPQSQSQILTSSDGITWTIVSVPFSALAINSTAGSIVSFDSNNVVLSGYNNQSGGTVSQFTNDGGVSWKGSVINSAGDNSTYAAGGDVYVSADGLGGGGCAFGGNFTGGYYGGVPGQVLSLQTLSAGGAFYRTGATAITPTNANASVFVRVE